MALVAALLLSLTYVPAAMQLVLRRRDVPARVPWLVRGAERVYGPLLNRVLPHPVLVSVGALGLLGVGLFLFSRAGTSFIPQLDEGDLVVQTVRRPDLRIETAVADSLSMEAAILQDVPEVRHVASRIGSPAVATDIMGIDRPSAGTGQPRVKWQRGVQCRVKRWT